MHFGSNCLLERGNMVFGMSKFGCRHIGIILCWTGRSRRRDGFPAGSYVQLL
jgi:hypothetical protein